LAAGKVGEPGRSARADPHDLGRGPRALLYTFGALLLLASLTLYVFPEGTDRFFAWTIQPPVTAAFLGGGYGAGLIAVVVSLRQAAWPPVRFGLEAVFVFVATTTVATLLHLDRFHFAVGGLPFVAAVAWLAVYLVAPAWILLVLLQNRVPGRRLAPGTLPTTAKAVLLAQGLALGGLALTLFIAPAAGEHLWPWSLSPLTARAVAAWLLMLAAAALLATREPHRVVLEVPAAIYLAIALLQAGALARFRTQVAWDQPAAWLLTVLLAVVAATGLAGMLYAHRARSAETTSR
jgi:hypothetical protein